MPAGIEWQDIHSADCRKLEELRRRVHDAKTAKGNSNAGFDDLVEKYGEMIKKIEQQMLSTDKEIELVGTWMDQSKPQQERDAAEARLENNLDLMKKRLDIWNESWEQQELYRMAHWIDSYLRRCREIKEPVFRSPHYPAVRDDPMRFFKQLLGWR